MKKEPTTTTAPAPNFYFDNQPDNSPITIRTRRPMMLRRCGEAQTRHAERGQEVTVTAHDAGQLDRCDFEIVPG